MPRWVAWTIGGLVASLVVAVLVVVGSQKNSSESSPGGAASVGGATRGPLTDAQVSQCVTNALAIFNSPEYQAGYNPRTWPTPVFFEVDVRFSGDNAAYYAYRNVVVGDAMLKFPDFSATLRTALTFPGSPERRQIEAVLRGHCEKWTPQTAATMRSRLADAGRSDIRIFLSPAEVCRMYCSPLWDGVPPGCYVSQPWSCAGWVARTYRNMQSLQLGFETLASPGNDYAWFNGFFTNFDFAKSAYDSSSCVGSYTNVSYPRACWDAWTQMQVAIYQFRNRATALPGYASNSPTTATSVLTTANSPRPTTSEAPASASPINGPSSEMIVQDSLVTPSGNIWCALFSDGLVSCLIRTANFQVGDCYIGEPGIVASIQPSGIADIAPCQGDIFVESSKLPAAYGSTIRMGMVTCGVSEQGVDCQNADHHGFKLSRAAFVPY